ncbi:hypothetical protein [Yersinia enterocolitica]|uniref:hypothetical protein n=1 Tax=Yersinia enterocolitica TaxID=630 RepID=UPI0005A47180|nr:hypothetical protein [Yersinia enterocolitica]
MKEQKDINTVIESHHDVMYKEQVIEYADYTLKSDSHYNKDGLLHLINFEKKMPEELFITESINSIMMIVVS